MVNENTEPTPIADFTLMVPPSSSTYAFVMDRPNPSPLNLMEKSSSILLNLSNIILMLCSAIPNPVSCTHSSILLFFLSIS